MTLVTKYPYSRDNFVTFISYYLGIIRYGNTLLCYTIQLNR